VVSPAVVEQLSPQPFRQWCAWRIDPSSWDRPGSRPVEEEATVIQLAFDLGIGDRRLRRWRSENKSLERIDVEEALHRIDVQLWEVYPDIEPVKVSFRGNQPGFGSRLSDEAVRRLHALHQQGATVRELGRRIWEPAGYSSIDSAENAVRRGFRRLGLECVALPVSRFGRCKDTRKWWPNKGAPCSKFAMVGSDFCMQHDEERRAEVLAQTSKALQVRHRNELKEAA
jgi:hypothetical protein